MKRLCCAFLAVLMLLSSLQVLAYDADYQAYQEHQETQEYYEEEMAGTVYDPNEESVITPTEARIPEPHASPPLVHFAAQDNVARYTILVLDTSGGLDFLMGGNVIYSADTSLGYVTRAASRFVSDIANAGGTNYVAVVAYTQTARIVSDFTTNHTQVQNEIERLTPGIRSLVNMASGLQQAYSLLQGIRDENAIKNVVLISTGVTGVGEFNYSGRYSFNTVASNWFNTMTGVRLFAYANVAYAAAERIWPIANLYSIGLFRNFEDIPPQGHDLLAFFRLTALDIATSPDFFFDVVDPNDLEFIFGGIAGGTGRRLTGNFNFSSPRNDGAPIDSTARFFWDEYYFARPASEFNPSLATMSLSLAMSAFNSNVGGTFNYRNKPQNAEELLSRLDLIIFELMTTLGEDREQTQLD